MCSHQPQVVGDEQIGQLELLLQIHQQVHDLRLNRDVERRDGLVGDDERRVQRQRAGEADPLPLPAAELVRIARELRRVEPDERRTAPRTRARRAALLPSLVDDQRLFDDVADAHARVERAVGILEDDLHVAARAGACARSRTPARPRP